jgi:hypothetical protein
VDGTTNPRMRFVRLAGRTSAMTTQQAAAQICASRSTSDAVRSGLNGDRPGIHLVGGPRMAGIPQHSWRSSDGASSAQKKQWL